MEEFAAPLIGGLMLSASTTSMLALHGRVLGMSGLVHQTASSVVRRKRLPEDWRLSTMLGVVCGGAIAGLAVPLAFETGLQEQAEWGRTLLAGTLVGIGTKLGSGCTSGHMLCGLSRLSQRSFVATSIFFSVATITARLYPGTMSAPTTAWRPDLTTLALLQLPLIGYQLVPALIKSVQLKRIVSAWSIGCHFAFGLALAGMTRPQTVLSFFYFPLPGNFHAPGKWDPSLAFVALGGLLPNMAAWQKIKTWEKPKFEGAWSLPRRQDIDWRLIAGASLFGIGWGLAGICPGPLLAVLGSGTGGATASAFAGAFFVGGVLSDSI